MSKSLLLSNPNISPGTVDSYSSIGEFTFTNTSGQDATESNAQITIRAAGTFSNVGVVVTANSDVSNRTVTLRKNTADGNQSFSITAAGTGLFQDSTNSDSVSAGDLVCIKIAGQTSITVRAVFVVFAPSSNTIALLVTFRLTYSTASTTSYFSYSSNVGAPTTTEADAKIKIKNAGTLRYFYTNVLTNTSTNAITMGNRINGANGNLTLSITASGTGVFEDTSNSDTVSSGDDINGYITSGAGTVNPSFNCTSITYESTNKKYPFYGFAGNYGTGSGQNANLTRYVAFTRGATFNTTETGTSQVQPIFNQTASLLGVKVITNGVTATSTLKFRVNGANGNQSISIGSGTTGYLEDTTNVDSLVGTENINYQVVTGATGTNIRFAYFHVLFTNALPSLLPLMGIGI